MRDAAFSATAAEKTTPDQDPFQVGEAVVYLAHGVGRIDSIGDEEIGGHKLRIIQISFPESSMTLRLPAAKARVSGLRRVSSPEALEAALVIVGQRPHSSKMAWAKRAQDYTARINSGDVRVLAGAVRDLQYAADGASTSQRTLFELASSRLAAEYAVSAGIEQAEALARIMAALRKPGEQAA
jgi:CarD family transcriptional regulator